VDSEEAGEIGTVVNGLPFLVVGPLHESFNYLVGLAHCLPVVLMPLRMDLAALVCGGFVVVCHYQRVNTDVIRRPAQFA
jgi:hypothetical protein